MPARTHPQNGSSPDTERVGRGRTWPSVAALVILALAVCLPAIDTGTFINGPDSVLRLPLVSHPRNVATIFSQDFMMFTDGQFRPLGYAILATVRGFIPADDALLWHLWLAAFHALGTVLVFGVARALSSKTLPALVAGAVFAVHPMTSIWANDVNRFHLLLGGTLFLGAFLAYVHYVTSGKIRTYILSAALFALGLLTSKMLWGLPALLGVYEFAYLRSRARPALARLAPFAVVCVALAPCYLLMRAHPMFYDTLRFPPGMGWNSAASFVGRSGLHLKAVAFGVGFEVPLRELFTRVTSPVDAVFLIGGVVTLVAAALTVYLLVRRRWVALTLVLAAAGVAPFVSTTWHHVRDYATWDGLYLALAAWALVVGALVEAGLAFRRRGVRVCVACATAAVVACYATLLVDANLRARSPERWWEHVLTLRPQSETASVELGRSAVDAGDVDAALRHLFRPAVRDTFRGNLLMARHYALEGEVLAAAVHFRSPPTGQTGEMHAARRIHRAAAEILFAANAFDYVEHALAQVLMRNRYDTAAMRLVAKALARKGRFNAAHRYLERAHRIDPGDVRTAAQMETLEQWMSAPGPRDDVRVVPPDPWLLQYIMSGVVGGDLPQRLVALAGRFPADPVIQLRAGASLVQAGRPWAAREMIRFAMSRLPHHPDIREYQTRIEMDALALARLREAVALAGDDVALKRVLAQALATRERFDEAIAILRDALDLARRRGDEDLARRIQRDIERYVKP